MYKTLLSLCGVALLAAPSLHAQGARSFHGSTGGGARPAFSSSNGARSFNSGRSYANRGYRGNYYRGGYHGGHGYGRRYYLGGIGYYYPYYGLGFGYPYYGYGGSWSGYAGAPYGYGYGVGPNDGVYEGRVTDQGASAGREGQREGGASLPTAVQRQLVKRGYYKGSVDGDFGPASRSALSRFQKDNDLKTTGRIDEDTLEKLGFSDRP